MPDKLTQQDFLVAHLYARSSEPVSVKGVAVRFSQRRAPVRALSVLRLGCLDEAVALGIEGHGADGRPVAGLPAPALRVALACSLVERMALGEEWAVLPGMALCRGDIADAAVAVLVVVPDDEACRPCAGVLQVGKLMGRYLAVRKSASAKTLSSLTLGRE